MMGGPFKSSSPEWATDASGNPTGLVGPDGVRRPLRFGRKAVLLGDSIAANNWAYTAGTSGQSTYAPRGVFIHANVELGWPWDIVANGGVSGETSDEILARVDALLSTYSPDWVLIPGGFINDVLADSTSATIITNLEQILAKCSGLNIVWVTGLPSSLNAGTAARKKVLHAVNRWLKDQQGDVPGLTVVDGYSAFVDVTNGNHKSTYSSDNLHPNTLGAAAVSKAIVRAMNVTGGIMQSPWWATGVDDYKNMLYNPYAVGDNAGGAGGFTQGAGVTGDHGPNGWTTAVYASGTGVLNAKVASTTEVQGEWVEMTATAHATNNPSGAGFTWNLIATTARFNTTAYQLGARILVSGRTFRCIVAGTSHSSAPDFTTAVDVGDTVTEASGGVTWALMDTPTTGDIIKCAVEFEADTATAGAMVYAFIQASGSNTFRSGCLFPESGDTLASPISSGVLVLPEFEVQAGTTQITFYVRAACNNGANSVDVRLRRVGAWITNR